MTDLNLEELKRLYAEATSKKDIWPKSQFEIAFPALIAEVERLRAENEVLQDYRAKVQSQLWPGRTP